MRRNRVAVIDDDESVRTALVRLFRSVDFETFAFASARAFLSEFRDLTLDCVVLDLQMPEMTGLDLQRYLKMVYPSLSLPVVMITAHDEPGSARAVSRPALRPTCASPSRARCSSSRFAGSSERTTERDRRLSARTTTRARRTTGRAEPQTPKSASSSRARRPDRAPRRRRIPPS